MRIRGLQFIPSSVNFSDLSPAQESYLHNDLEERKQEAVLDKELLLLKTMSGLSSDKERCVLLLEILREYGYQIDYGSIAQALGIKLRWFMRVKKSVWQKVRNITTNE